MTAFWHWPKLARIKVNAYLALVDEFAPEQRREALQASIHVLAGARWFLIRSLALLAGAGLACVAIIVWIMGWPNGHPAWLVFICLGANGYAALESFSNTYMLACEWLVPWRALHHAMEELPHA